jgi:hypothetical protein
VSTTDETLDNVDNSFPNTSLWRLKIQCSDSRTYYWVLDGRPDRDNHYFVIHFLHVVLAVATRVRKTVFTRHIRQNAYQLAIQSLVSLPRSRRTVEFDCPLTPEVQRVIAFHCSPAVELDVKVIPWTGYARLVVHHMFAARNAFFPALAGTTRIEELTVHVQDVLGIDAALIAIGKNRGIRFLVAMQEGPVTVGMVRTFWESVMQSPTIVSVDASGITGNSARDTPGIVRPWPALENAQEFNEEERRESAELVAELIRNNPRITNLAYHSQAHDERIMTSRVVPIVRLNRLRPIVASLPCGSVGDMARERSVSALLGSPIVRQHPELFYVVLNSTRDCLLASQD